MWFFKEKFISYYPPISPMIDLRMRLPRKNINKLTVLNVGVGEGNSGLALQLPYFDFFRLDCIDVFQGYLDNARARTWAAQTVNFINADVRNFGTSIYDIVLMFDVLEHLPKKDSLAVIDSIKCNQVIFIPLENEYRENRFGVKSQDHLSFWTEADFKERGYKTQVLQGFHHDKNITWPALWAIKYSDKKY